MKRQYAYTRREAIGLGLGAVAATAVSGLAGAASPGVTPAQTEGPFYPVSDQPDEDLDLTRISGHENSAKGQIIVVEGRLLDEHGKPVPDALVEIWQANTFGRYHHERDTSPAPEDPDFQGWGQVLTDADGRYRFRTIKPGSYVAMEDWSRPPHIHFKVAKRGFHELTTQMYFTGEELNHSDRILQALTPEQQALVVVDFDENTADPHSEPHGRFDIVVRAVS